MPCTREAQDKARHDSGRSSGGAAHVEVTVTCMRPTCDRRVQTAAVQSCTCAPGHQKANETNFFWVFKQPLRLSSNVGVEKEPPSLSARVLSFKEEAPGGEKEEESSEKSQPRAASPGARRGHVLRQEHVKHAARLAGQLGKRVLGRQRGLRVREGCLAGRRDLHAHQQHRGAVACRAGAQEAVSAV